MSDLRIPTRLPDLVAAWPKVYRPWQPGDPQPPYEAEIDVDLQVEARREREHFEPEWWGGEDR